MTTLESLRTAILGETETYPIHEAVASYAEDHKGKPITKRDVAALETANPGWRFTLHSGNSWAPGKELSFWEDNKWTDTRSELRIATGPGLSRWSDAATIKTDTQNARYFKFANARNADRAALLGDKAKGLVEAAKAIDAIELLVAELKGAIETYELDAASYRIRELLKEKTGEEFKLY